MSEGPHHDLLTEKVAIDCEMMRSNIGQLLGRVSVVNYEGKTIFDTFVCYPEPVHVTNTHFQYSGIRLEDIDPKNGAMFFSEVQAHLIQLLRGRTVIGHDVKKDLGEISRNLPACISRFQGKYHQSTPITFDIAVRDTQTCRRYQQYAKPKAHQGPDLKSVAVGILGRHIKQGRVSSVEDAVATMEIYRKAEAEIEEEQGNSGRRA